MKRFSIETEITPKMSTKDLVDALMWDVIPNTTEDHNCGYDGNTDRPTITLSVAEMASFLEDLINGILNRDPVPMIDIVHYDGADTK